MSYEFGKRILVTFDLANNFDGSFEKANKLIDEIYTVTSPYTDLFDFSIKTQYRQLDSFIHSAYKNDFNYKYVKRFTEAKIDNKDYATIHRVNKNRGFITMTTPFDEFSVDLAIEHDIDIIKVASVSFDDWPLLNKIVNVEKPIILSVATKELSTIDKVVAFFEHRNKQIALCHCVAEYPCKKENMQLNQIDILRKRYPNIEIGISTHASPEDDYSSDLCAAKGCKLYEFHYGLSDKKNAYSKDKYSVASWLATLKSSVEACGIENERYVPSDKELNDIRGLKRGVWAKEDIKVGDRITREKVYYAIPLQGSQITANQMSKYAEIVCHKDILKDEPVYMTDVSYADQREKAYKIIEETKEILKNGNIHLPNKIDIHISHHKGIENFYHTGAVILDVINREYCKKIIVVFPNQKHPEHYHRIKEETFMILYGSMKLNDKEYKKGDVVVVERNEIHGFESVEGCVFEEISTTHYQGDSYYLDPEISKNNFRKTEMTLRDI